jgi:hypothetical protein
MLALAVWWAFWPFCQLLIYGMDVAERLAMREQPVIPKKTNGARATAQEPRAPCSPLTANRRSRRAQRTDRNGWCLTHVMLSSAISVPSAVGLGFDE